MCVSIFAPRVCTETYCCRPVTVVLDHMITNVVLLKKPIQEGATSDRVEMSEILFFVVTDSLENQRHTYLGDNKFFV